MENLLNGWGTTLATFSPLVGVAIMMLIPGEREHQHKMVALVTSLWVAFLGVLLLIWFDMGQTAQLQFVVDKPWIDVISSRYLVGIDGMSLPLILLTMLIVPLCIVYSWDHFPDPVNPKAFLILILILETGMIGTFVAQDLVLFFVFFEVVLLPMFFMIAVWGGEDRRYASLKFFLYTLFGSALMLVSFLALFFLTGADTFSFAGLSDAVAAGGVSHTAQLWIFGGMFLGFAIKVPMFPFHTWLPDAHTQAPTVGSVILAAVLLKLGTYGFVRIAIPILPEAAVAWAPWIGLLAVIGIIYGALGCLAQTDMKRLIAFSSVAHMGFVMLGIATLTDFGINAAIMGMVAHGLITGMLFFVAGSVKERFHTLEINRLGGLLVQAPRMGWIFGFCVMASLGLPGLAGFWGEFPAILSAYQPANGVPVEIFRVYMVVAALGTVLAAGYLLWLLQRVAFGNPTEEFAEAPNITDTTKHEWIAWAPLLALIVAIGIYPNLVFRVTDGAVDASLNECLRVDVQVLTADEVAALGCSDVYGLGGGSDAPVEHAVGN
ncbi:MAG TPA: NADH-quinone oxidoreductase chain 13 [Acidimicrobiaceae bacterium]|jgi:NADH-quinone oxidoreductase subunit M|nr:NADH-quinone oxidoreductase chain 13 [Acidimicrobiaceae bacterium]HAZ56676.1 NADH-quinone oxidoreductase chain 13 [Acidimicrobiaceae bacterium]HIE67206.1 NADH-quinone oxidoreductase subunit M [Acidimicrobiia bacterium]HIL47626.1 NADH-quinone oxidoreductase subunit M [Acidimicrobiia bacterium]